MSADWVEPREDCPECGAGLLVERFQSPREGALAGHAPVKFCSYVSCEWSDHPELSPDCCSVPPRTGADACGYCGATSFDDHEDDCKPSYRS